MDKLWAPWRIKYITQKKQKGCIFCQSLKNEALRAKARGFLRANTETAFISALKDGVFKRRMYKTNDYVLFKGKYSLCILNIFPYNNGHVMVAPRRHVGDISRLKKYEILDLFNSVAKIKKRLDKRLKPEGYNIGINLAAVAGAGIPEHLHIHIVPRWKGDTNFMPVVYDIKVVSQSLDELYKILKDEN